MDKLTRTANSALVAYYNNVRRMGSVGRQDKYRLLVLWYFNWLKNHTDFLYKWDETANGDIGGFVVDKKLEASLEKQFGANLQCLLQSSCFVKLHADDECVPLSGMEWYHADNYDLMVTNDTPFEINNTWPQDDILELLAALSAQYPDTDFMVENDDDNTFMVDNI